MKLGEALLKILSKKFEPDTLVETKFKNYDMSVKTDSEGRAILLFLGKRDEKGTIHGERFARTLKTDAKGLIIKDHWERKGPAS